MARIGSAVDVAQGAPTGTLPEQTLIHIEEILRHLPHRYPMLLVDRILEYSAEEKRCRGIKCVTMNEHFFQGHYPGRPIMPGVLILEALAQCGAAITLMDPAFEGSVPLIGAIDKAKFKRVVVPGDVLTLDCRILRMKGSVGIMEGIASVEGDIAAQMEMTFKLRAQDR